MSNSVAQHVTSEVQTAKRAVIAVVVTYEPDLPSLVKFAIRHGVTTV